MNTLRHLNRLLLLAACALLLPFAAMPAQGSGNVSNLTLIDTLNPDLEVLAATISTAERDAVFWQLNPRNRRGVFMSAGPNNFTGGSSGPAGFLTLPKVSGGNWQLADLTETNAPLFLYNRGLYATLPWANSNSWYFWTVYGRGIFWNQEADFFPLKR